MVMNEACQGYCWFCKSSRRTDRKEETRLEDQRPGLGDGMNVRSGKEEKAPLRQAETTPHKHGEITKPAFEPLPEMTMFCCL